MSENKPKKDKADPATKRILVLDDDESIRHMIQATLEVEGFRVRTGRDGHNIIDLVQQFKPDLIISDVMMPNGGGFELLRTLQGDPDARHIPVLIVSGHGFDGSTKAMFEQESNVTGFMPKPLRMGQFVLKVHQLLNTLTKEEKIMNDRKDMPGLDRDRFEGLY